MKNILHLYRIVSNAEKDDYNECQHFRTHKNTLEAKQFFKSVEAIDDFYSKASVRGYEPKYDCIFDIIVDEVKFNAMHRQEMILDGFDAVSIDELDLPEFNDCVIFVKQKML